MFRFFRDLRRNHLSGGRFGNYLPYALGEIVLVVTGILIALQVNNANDQRKARVLERAYLANIRVDLSSNIERIDDFLKVRSGLIEDAIAVVTALEDPEFVDVEEFNRRCIRVYEWNRFVQINFTFEELVYSGNLALITNHSIKSSMLRLEAAYQENKAQEDHLRFDAEELLYKPLYAQIDLHPMLRSFAGEADVLDLAHLQVYRSDPKFKNGFLMTRMELTKLNGQLEEMRELCEEAIVEIDRELAD